MPVVWGQVIIKINVDAWRHNLFKSGKCSDDLLPPTCGSLVKHFEQANSQSAICSQCLIAGPSIHSSIGNGWKVMDKWIDAVVWMTAPQPHCQFKVRITHLLHNIFICWWKYSSRPSRYIYIYI